MQLYKSKYLKAKHAFSSRKGGVSKAPFSSLNFAYHVGDRREDVVANHKIFADRLGYDLKKLTFMNQIHSNEFAIVDENSFLIPSCDALLTNVANRALMVMSADCAPVLMHDPIKGVIAAVHAGRAGAFGNIVGCVVEVMKERYGSNPCDVEVAVGPRICAACYDVSYKEIAEAKSLGYGFACKGDHLDIDAVLKYQLLESGVTADRMDFLPYCTQCDHEEFFSYRAKKVTGRNASVIVL